MIRTTPPLILYAEDDPDDLLLMQMAHRASELDHPIIYVNDGQEAVEYLHGEGQYALAPLPGIILMDLRMPHIGGLATLVQLKSDPRYSHIPVIMITTSTSRGDVHDAYAAGASSYIVKPPTLGGLVGVLNAIARYWFQAAVLPTGAER